MSKTNFEGVIIIGRPSTLGVPETLAALISHLNEQNIAYKVEQQTSMMLPADTNPIKNPEQNVVNISSLKPGNDLLVVIGGDGSILIGARQAIKHKLPILGINHGKLGFLADIAPDQVEIVSEIVRGEYKQEQRLLLAATVYDQNGKELPEGECTALNDVVLTPGNTAQMISYAIAIDDQPVCQQRADGLIIATPTGSTAYALSAGGPIVNPNLEAMILVPMLPHKLSSRPIVVSSNSTINIQIAVSNNHSPSLSSDGGRSIRVAPGYSIEIKSYAQKLKLIHPKDYNYYDTLRQKLGWERIN
jgi:NAD+ kinase